MMQTKMEKASTHVFEHLKADCFIYKGSRLDLLFNTIHGFFGKLPSTIPKNVGTLMWFIHVNKIFLPTSFGYCYSDEQSLKIIPLHFN